MANLSLTRVNQKLMQAKLLLQSAEGQGLTAVQLHAILEGAAFHLVCAYHHYLREIAETYNLKNAIALRTEADLVTAFETAKKYPAEAEELVSLRKEPASWLAQLQVYYDFLWRTPVISTTGQETGLISLVDEDKAEAVAVNLERLTQWQRQFVELVIRQRATSAEF